MNFKDFYKIYLENEFKLENPREDQWYKTFDPFFPDANKREEDLEEPIYTNYDDWTDYLDFEDSIEIIDLDRFIKRFKLIGVYYLNNQYLNLYDNKNSYWLEKSDDLYEKIESSNKDMENDYIPNLPEHIKLELLNLTEDDIYISSWETTIGEMRKEPGNVYHYTTEEKWEKIEKSKKMLPSYGSGLTNRNASGIFTSVSPDTYAEGTYGDVLLEIDLSSFKKGGGFDELVLEPEPDVLEAAINQTFANALGFSDYDEYISSDMSPETVIVGHVIPIKYIKRL